MSNKPDYTQILDIPPYTPHPESGYKANIGDRPTYTPYGTREYYDVDRIRKQPHLFTPDQLDLIREFFPDFPDTSYANYDDDLLCDMIEEIGFQAVACLNEDYTGPVPEKAERLRLCYSILDMLGEM